MRRVRFGAIFFRISDRFGNFRKFSAATPLLAQDCAEIRSFLRAAAWPRASEVPRHCAERRHAAAREIRCDSRRSSDRNFQKNFAAAKFFDRNRARSRQISLLTVLQRLTDRPRFVNLPQHHAAREIRCDSRRISDRNFRKFSAAAKFLRSKSREIAPKSMPPCVAQLAYDPQRSLTTMPSVGMLRRVRLHAI